MKNILLSAMLLSVLTVTTQARVTCSQFNTQAEAQRYFNAEKRGSKGLDRDKDGEACECLSGGSAYSKPVCKRWRKKYGK